MKAPILSRSKGTQDIMSRAFDHTTPHHEQRKHPDLAVKALHTQEACHERDSGSKYRISTAETLVILFLKARCQGSHYTPQPTHRRSPKCSMTQEGGNARDWSGARGGNTSRIQHMHGALAQADRLETVVGRRCTPQYVQGTVAGWRT